MKNKEMRRQINVYGDKAKSFTLHLSQVWERSDASAAG